MLKANKEQYFSILADACLKIDGTDTVGKTLQEWLKEYLKANDHYFREPANKQAFSRFLR